MACPRCGFENQPQARFCGGCGRALAEATACPSCGTANAPGHRFCNGCGRSLTDERPAPDPRAYTPPHLVEKILRSRATLTDERKHVTVLFSDVKESMDLAGAVDAEVWHRIMDRFFDILTEGVHRFEGTVNQYTGDGIMALFGAPIAHEDHAQRACYAALYLADRLSHYARTVRREHGLSFSVRMGLNSGEVVVGTIGDDLRMDYTAIGHTVGLASRMEQLAEPGRAYLTEATAALVRGFFEVEDLGPFDVRGAAQPVRVFELRGPGEHRTRLDAARARGFSRFVGRSEELAIVQASLDEAEQSRGQILGIVGEPGVGKSRLCEEIVRRARSSGLKVFEAHGVAHGKAMPFLPVLELLRGYFGIEEGDGAVAARQKIAGSLLLLDDDFRDALPLVFDFLGVTDPDLPFPNPDPEARMMQLFGVVGQLMRARSDRGPALIVIEDLHWLDEGSASFVEHLVDAVQTTRTLVLTNFRPPYRPAWTARSHYRQVALRPLDLDEVEELLIELLGADPTLLNLRRRIAERTGGNPFFIEEVIRALVGTGGLTGERGAYTLTGSVEHITIPPTVQAVLAARIDRLPEQEKAILGTASVLGRDFAEPVLRHVVEAEPLQLGAALRALVAGEFLYERSLYPEAEYAFRHPLTQEVAYATQLAERRRVVHRAVAEAMVDLYGEGTGERASVIAHHFAEADEPYDAARWSRRAAEWAGQNDPHAALRHWRAVRRHIGALEPSDERDGFALASCIGIMNHGARSGLNPDEAAALFGEGIELAQHRGDTRSLARLRLVYGRLRGQAGEIEEAVGHSLEAAHLAEQSGWSGLRLAAAVNLSAWYWQMGDLLESLRVTEDSTRTPPSNLRRGAEHLGYSPYIWLVMQRGRLLPWLGRCDEAKEAASRAIRLAREHGEREVLCWAHQGQVDCAWLTGDVAGAITHARQAVDIAERMGTSLLRWSSHYGLGRAHILRGEWDAGVECLERALGIIRDTRTGLHGEILVLTALAEAQLGRGATDLAVWLGGEAVELSRRYAQRPGGIRAHVTLARVLRTTRGAEAIDEIDGILGRAQELLERETTPVLEPFLRSERAAASGMRGDDEARARDLREAHRQFTAMGARARARDLEPQLARL